MGFPMPWHCLSQPEQPRKRQRPRIDISKIGAPTNFQHTGHIGTGEMAGPSTLSTAKTQMQSKGGISAPSSPTIVASPVSSPSALSGPASNALSLEEAQRLFGAKKAAAAAAAAAAAP